MNCRHHRDVYDEKILKKASLLSAYSLISFLVVCLFFITATFTYGDIGSTIDSGFGRLIHLLQKKQEQNKTETGEDIRQYRYAYFKDFIVNINSLNSRNGILLCDIVVELNNEAKLTSQKVELRKAIYNTTKSFSRGITDIRSLKRRLRDRIKINMNDVIGREIIKEVHFTKFVVF